MERVFEIITRIRAAALEARQDGQLAHAEMLEGIAMQIEADFILVGGE